MQIYPSIHPSIYLSIYLFVCLFVCLSIYLSIDRSIDLSIYLCLCVRVCVCVWIWSIHKIRTCSWLFFAFLCDFMSPGHRPILFSRNRPGKTRLSCPANTQTSSPNMARLLEPPICIAHRLGWSCIYHNVDIGSLMIAFTFHFLPFDSDVKRFHQISPSGSTISQVLQGEHLRSKKISDKERGRPPGYDEHQDTRCKSQPAVFSSEMWKSCATGCNQVFVTFLHVLGIFCGTM